MALLILDTNVVSYLMKGPAHRPQKDIPWAEKYRPLVEGHQLAISFMTVSELFEGAYRRGWSDARLARLEETLHDYLVIPSTPTICRIWGRIRADRRQQPIAVDDAWIAATAIAYHCPLVTHNPSDFRGIAGLSIVTAQVDT